MKVIQNQEDLQIRKCQIHKNCEIEFILANNTTNLQKNQLGLCYKCIPTLKIKSTNLILCQDFIKGSDNEILQNWPPLSNNYLIKELEQCYKNNTLESSYETITKFFDDFQNEFLQNIQNTKKMIFSTIDQKFLKKEEILKKYDEISQKEQLKSLLSNYYYQQNDKDEELLQFIKDFNERKKENTEKIDNLLQSCNLDEFPNLDVLNKLKDMMNILINLISQSNGKFDDTVFQNLELLEQKIFQVMSLFQYKANEEKNEDLLQISKQNFQCKKEMLEFLQKKEFFNSNLLTKKLTELIQNYKQTQNEMRNILQVNRNLIDKQKFTSTNIYTQINVIKDGILQITNLQPYKEISIFYQQNVLPCAKYTIRIELKPFQDNQNNYTISLGVAKISNFKKNEYFLSNQFANVQQKAEKGCTFNNSVISFSPKMRKLEMQIILKKKYLRLTDYPHNQNIIFANKDSLDYQLNDLSNFLICFKLNHVQFMEIIEFKQEISLDEFPEIL